MSQKQDRITFFGVLIAVVVVVLGYLQLGSIYPVAGRAEAPLAPSELQTTPHGSDDASSDASTNESAGDDASNEPSTREQANPDLDPDPAATQDESPPAG